MSMSAGTAPEPAPRAGEASARLRRRVRLLFVATLLVWGVQFVFHELISEPWPSLTFPRFGRVGGDYDPLPTHYALGEIVLYDAAGGSVTTTPEELFAGLDYNRGAIFNRQFSPRGVGTEEDTVEGGGLLRRIHAWPSARMEDLLGDVPPFTRYYAGRDGQPRGNTSESRAWLGEVIEAWRPGAQFERADFIWYSYKGRTLGLDLAELPIAKETYVVSLR